MVGVAGHLAPGAGFLLFGGVVFFMDPLCEASADVAGAIFPHRGFGLLLLLFGGLFGTLDLFNQQLLHGESWALDAVEIHTVHHFLMFQAYGGIGLAETIVRKYPGLLIQEAVALSVAAACFLEGFLMMGHFDAKVAMEEQLHLLIVLSAFASSLSFAAFAAKPTSLYRNIGLYFISLRGLMYIIIALWYLALLRSAEDRPRCAAECNDPVAVKGSPHFSLNGRYSKQEAPPASGHDGRPIFKSDRGQFYMYYWSVYSAWRIGADHGDPVAVAFSGSHGETCCPHLASGWRLYGDSVQLEVVLANVRIAGGGSRGRLEVQHRGAWGAVCDEGFTGASARVACRSLGMTGGARYAAGGGDGTMWLGYVSCGGREPSITACAHGDWGNHTCDHGDAVGIACDPPCADRRFCTHNSRSSRSQVVMEVHIVTGAAALLLGLAFVLRLSHARRARRCTNGKARNHAEEMVSIVGRRTIE